MKLTFINLILLSLIFSFFASCRDKYEGEPLGLKNNSDTRIYYWYSYWQTENFDQYHFPDTNLPKVKPIYINSIAPNNITGVGESDPDWDEIFSKLKEGKFSVYFFESNPENQLDWDSIRINYQLTRKDVTLTELKSLNYIIQYP